MVKWVAWVQVAAAATALLSADAAFAKKRYALVTGRRLPLIYAIDLDVALRPENNNTPNAIVSRAQSTPARLDGTYLGDPANVALSADQKKLFVMNHHGAVTNIEFKQHGGRAGVSQLDVDQLVRRQNDLTANAVDSVWDGGWFGGVGLLVRPDYLLISYSEGWLSEDGSNRIGILDRRTGGMVHQIEMPLTGPGTRQLRTGCTPFPVPFVSPTPAAFAPNGEAFLSDLDPQDFGCWPDPEALAFGNGSDGKTYLISGNAGTEDVSIMDFDAALAGQKVVEVAPRIPVQTGPFGIRASPNGKYVAVTARESNITGAEGNTISIIDVDAARQGLPGGEAARVVVGSSGEARPFTTSWTPDGTKIVVPNFRSNNVSVVDLAKALAHDPGAEVARIPLVRADGAPARPKGSFVTADGRYAVISGGANTLGASTTNATGTMFIIDLTTYSQVATVTGVGIDPYNLVVTERDDSAN